MEQSLFPGTWADRPTWPGVLELGLEHVRFQAKGQYLQQALPIFQRVYRWLSRWLALLEQGRLPQAAAARRKVAALKVVWVMAKVLAVFAKKA